MTLNGLETPKYCKNYFIPIFFSFFCLHYFIFFTCFFIFRIIFGRTSYGTTVTNYIPTHQTLHTYLPNYLPLFRGSSCFRDDADNLQRKCDRISFLRRNPRNLQRSCLRTRISHCLPFPKCSEQRVFQACEGTSVVKIGANFSVRRTLGKSRLIEVEKLGLEPPFLWIHTGCCRMWRGKGSESVAM